MVNYRRTWLTKALLISIILATVVFAGCVGPRGWPGTASQGNTLYVCTMDGNVLALNAANGARKWVWKLPASQTGRAQLGNVSASTFFNCQRGGTGQLQPGYFYGAPALANETIYIEYFSGTVYAIDAKTGKEVWQHDVKSNIASGLTVAANTVFVGSSNGNLTALDAGNGTLKWQFSTKDQVWGTPSVVNGVVYFGSLDHSLYALNTVDGSMKWSFKSGGGIASTPLVVGGVVYVGSFDHKFYAVDANTGSEIWTFVGAGDWLWNEAIYVNGTVYVGCFDHNVYALDAGNGTPVWPKPYKAGSKFRSSPVVAGELLVVASGNGHVYGLNPLTGEKDWEFDGIKAKVLSPLHVSAGVVYINSQNNRLYALDAETGNEIWSVKLAD